MDFSNDFVFTETTYEQALDKSIVDNGDTAKITYNELIHDGIEAPDTIGTHNKDSIGNLGGISEANNSIDNNKDDNQIDIILTDDLKSFFSEGMVLPVAIRTIDSKADDSVELFADLYLSYTNESGLELQKISLYENLPFELSSEFKKALLSIRRRPFGNSQQLSIDENITLKLDLLSMNAIIVVTSDVFTVKQGTYDHLLGDASSQGVTDILKYNINGYDSFSSEGHSRSTHLLVDNILSWKEHHINVKGYGYYSDYNDYSNKEVDLDELTYEKDWDGHRFTTGMLQGWSLQSLGTVSTLNSQKLYGASYGNISKSIQLDKSVSLTPLVIYMPANGEVRIYRDGRLLDIQRLAMGNQEINTANFPRGSYEVKVDVITGGKVISTRRYPVNKLHQKTGTRGLGWQIWGGMTEVTEFQDDIDRIDYGYETTRIAPLLGISMASNWGPAQWNGSFYHNDSTQIMEGQVSLPFSDNLSLDVQTLAATDGSVRNVASINWSALDGAFNSWLTIERGHQGDVLDYSNGDTEMLGSNLYLGNWLPSAGTISLSYQQSHNIEQRYLNANYSHSFNTIDYGYWVFAVGANISDQQGTFGVSESEYYASVNVSIPLDTDFSIGASHSGGQRLLNFAARRNFEGAITGAGLDVSMANGGLYHNDTSVSTFANYDTRYAQGSVSYSASRDNRGLSLSTRGSIAMREGNIIAGNGIGQAGIVVALPDEVADTDLQADINHQHYPLHGGQNLIMVDSFNHYEIDVQHTQNAVNAYDIALEQQGFTLYPGNVVHVDVALKQMVTVFGRLANSNGVPLSNIKVKNHIGEAMTDDEGNFSIDVDARYPEILVNNDEHRFKVEMVLPSGETTAWVGDIIYNGPLDESYKIQSIIE